MFSFFKHQNHNKRKWKLQKKFLRRNIWTQCGTFEKNSGSRSWFWLWFWLWSWLWSWSGLEGAEATQGVEFRALWLQSSPCSPDRCCQSTRPRLIWCLGDRELSWPRWWIQSEDLSKGLLVLHRRKQRRQPISDELFWHLSAPYFDPLGCTTGQNDSRPAGHSILEHLRTLFYIYI